MTKNFIPRYPTEKPYPQIYIDAFIAHKGKVIFLGPENLELLKGYKAQVLPTKKQLLISIAGLSPKAMDALFEALKELKP